MTATPFYRSRLQATQEPIAHDMLQSNACMDSTPTVIQPDVAQAYAALARRVAAIDMALKCGATNPYIQRLIKAEIEEAVKVIHHYENPHLVMTTGI